MKKICLSFHKAAVSVSASIPMTEEKVKAGFPSPAQDCYMPEIDLNDLLVVHKEATFFVRISGDSMREAGIFDGDLAVVDKSLTAADGDFIIAYVNGDFTIKQFRLDKKQQKGWLVPWNKQYPEIEIDPNDDFRIWGVVTHVIHTVRNKFGHER